MTDRYKRAAATRKANRQAADDKYLKDYSDLSDAISNFREPKDQIVSTLLGRFIVTMPSSDDKTYVFTDMTTIKKSIEITWSQSVVKPTVEMDGLGWKIMMGDDEIGQIRPLDVFKIYNEPTHF